MDFRCLWFLMKGFFSESTHWSPLAIFHDAFCRCSGITEQHTYLRCSYTARCQVRIRPTPVSFVRPPLRALSVFQKRLRIYFTALCLWIVTYKDPKVRLYYFDMRFVHKIPSVIIFLLQMALIALTEARRLFSAGVRLFITPLRCLFTDAVNSVLFGVTLMFQIAVHFISTASGALQSLWV